MCAARATTRTSLLARLPRPEHRSWGVVLRYVGNGSDKEYRVMVEENATVFQWGRSGAVGETRVVTRVDHDTAVGAALVQWAAKEAKGYWPVTGVVRLPEGACVGSRRGAAVLWDTYGEAVRELAETRIGGGGEPWLCQLPERGYAWRLAEDALGRLSIGGEVRPEGYALLQVPGTLAEAVAACCPVAIPVRSERGTDPIVVAEVAARLMADAGEIGSVRTEFDRVLRAAEALLG